MKEKNEKTRRAILESANAEFVEKGFRDASLRNIAKRSGLTTGAIYTYFKSKDELFNTLVQPAVSQIDWQLSKEDPHLYDLDGEIDDKMNWFSMYLRFLIDLVEQHPDEMRLLFIGSNGSSYEGYQDELVERGKARALKNFRKLERTPEFEGEQISEFFVHNLVNYILNITTEMIKQGQEPEQLRSFEIEMKTFLFKGWNGLVKI